MAKSGQSLVAESIGTVRVKMLVKGKWLVAVVHDVLYVPGLQSNLFSVRRIEDNGMSLKIAGEKVSIQKKKKIRRIVCCGRRSGYLYALDIFRHDEAGCRGSATAMTVRTLHEKVGTLNGMSKPRFDARKKMVRLVKSDQPVDDESAVEGSIEKEFAAIESDSGGIEEPVVGSSGY